MTSATNLVSLTRPSLEIFNKFQTGVFLISGTTHDIDMKLGPVTERDKGNTPTSNKFDDEFMPINCDVIVFFFRFMTNLQPFGSRIPDAWSIKLTFSLTVTFYLTKPEKQNFYLAISKQTPKKPTLIRVNKFS